MSQIHPPNVRDWTVLNILGVVWGTAYLFISYALESFPPAGITLIRLTFAAVIITAFSYSRGRRLPALTDKRWLYFIGVGFFGYALPFYLIPLAQTQISSALAGILLGIMPLLTVVAAHFFTPEKMTRWSLGGFAIGFAGLIVLIGPAALSGLGGPSFLGQLGILGAAVCYAVNVILMRRAPEMPASLFGAGALICSVILIAPLGVWELMRNDLPLTASGTASLLWLGLGPTALATIFMMQVIARNGAGFLALVNYITPVVALAAGLLIGEAISWNAYLGLMIILAGIFLARRQPAAARHD